MEFYGCKSHKNESLIVPNGIDGINDKYKQCTIQKHRNLYQERIVEWKGGFYLMCVCVCVCEFNRLYSFQLI